jgi:hypothetical protein
MAFLHYMASKSVNDFYILLRTNSVSVVARLWAGRPGFETEQGREFSLSHPVQISCRVQPPFQPMGTGRCSQDTGQKLTTPLGPVQRSRMSEPTTGYLHNPRTSPWRGALQEPGNLLVTRHLSESLLMTVCSVSHFILRIRNVAVRGL